MQTAKKKNKSIRIARLNFVQICLDWYWKLLRNRGRFHRKTLQRLLIGRRKVSLKRMELLPSEVLREICCHIFKLKTNRNKAHCITSEESFSSFPLAIHEKNLLRWNFSPDLPVLFADMGFLSSLFTCLGIPM